MGLYEVLDDLNKDRNVNGDTKFLAEVEKVPGATGQDPEYRIIITDSYHQGIVLTINSLGECHAHFTGG